MIVQKKNSPPIRFQAFTTAWSAEAFEDLVEVGKKKHNPAKDQKSFPCVELEHIESETGRLLGNVESVNLASIKTKFTVGDVLYGKLRPYLKKFVLAPFDGVCSSEIWVFRGKTVTNQFLFYLIQTHKFDQAANMSTGSKMPRADWSFISSIGFSIPSLPEQQKIASFLSSVDERIELLEQKKEKLEVYKKGVMQQIFSQQIRFRQDDGAEFADWEERRAKEVFGNISNKRHNGDLPILSASQEHGMVLREESGIRIQATEKSVASYKVVEPDDFVISLRSFQGGLDHSKYYGICSPAYTILRSKIRTVPQFYRYFFKKESFIKRLSLTVVGIRDGKQITYDNFGQLKIPYPCPEEQQRIADFIGSLEAYIVTITKQIQALKNWKKGLLQQMFI